MSKKGAPRKAFTTYVEEKAADTIDLTDEDGNVLLAVPPPQFWGRSARERAQQEDAVGLFQELCGAEEFDEFAKRFPYEPDVVGNNVMSFVLDDLGVGLGESSASSKN